MRGSWERDPDSETGRYMMDRAREVLRERLAAPAERAPAAPLRDAPLDVGPAELRVRCPHCKAFPGHPCTVPSRPGVRPDGGVHPSRQGTPAESG